jgi:Peptidase_C39 like family
MIERRTSRNRRLELPVPVFTQREAECGNTSLKAVLAYRGTRVSAARLAALAGTHDEGTEHAGLVRAARQCGAAVFERSGGDRRAALAELRWFLTRGHPLLVGWWSQVEDAPAFDPRWTLAQRRANDSGHFSVVTGLDATRVQLMDPEARLRDGPRGKSWRAIGHRWMSHEAFLRVWYDTDTPKYRHVERWYLVVHDGAERFAPQLGGGVDFAPIARRRAEASGSTATTTASSRRGGSRRSRRYDPRPWPPRES